MEVMTWIVRVAVLVVLGGLGYACWLCVSIIKDERRIVQEELEEQERREADIAS
jgi:hypothetical protein